MEHVQKLCLHGTVARNVFLGVVMVSTTTPVQPRARVAPTYEMPRPSVGIRFVHRPQQGAESVAGHHTPPKLRRSKSTEVPRLPRFQAGMILTNGGSINGSTILRLSHGDPSKDVRLPAIDAASPRAVLAPAALPPKVPSGAANDGRGTPRTTESTSSNGADSGEAAPAPFDPAAGIERKPGEGIHASATSMAAPITWSQVKERTVAQVSRSRRRSVTTAGITITSQGLIYLDPEAPLCPPICPAHQVLAYLSKVPWFHQLTNTQLGKIIQNSVVVYFPKYTVVIRESSHGTGYYLVMFGSVVAASKRREFAVEMGPGTTFGESSLAPTSAMRREATCTALEDTWCLRMTVDVVQGFAPSAIEELERVYSAKLLGTVRWFDMLVSTKLLEVAPLMEVENYAAARPVFQQGEIAEKMYIVARGTVGIFLSLPPADGAAWATHNKLLAQFSSDSKSPWFGETALFGQEGQPPPTRGAGAFTLQATQLLSVHVSKAKQFIAALPEFAQMNKAYQKAYNKTNQLNAEKPLLAPPKKLAVLN